MARFFGAVGYGQTALPSDGSGVSVDVITEHSYYGDEVRVNGQLDPGEHLNDDISVQNSISIVADQYAYENFQSIRYVVWRGNKWKVSGVQVSPPRLIISFGKLYNGPGPEVD